MKKLILLPIFAIVFSSCAHFHEVNGPVTASEIPEGIQVSIGSSEVVAGDTVTIKRKICRQVAQPRGNRTQQCSYLHVAESTVLKVLDQDSSIIRHVDGLDLSGTVVVEKKK